MKSAYLLTLLLCFHPAWAQGEEKENETASKPKLHYGFAITASGYGDFEVSNVPESVRAVPLHRDDSYISSLPFATRPIVDDGLGNFSFSSVGFDLIATYRWLELGGRLSYVAVASDRVQQNQLGGTERGTGTSLRFYELEARNPVDLLVTAGIRIPLVPPRVGWSGIRLVLGGEYDPIGTALQFRTGWDRFGEDENWRHFKAGRIYNHALYARLDVALDEGIWISLQANQPKRRLALEPGFRNLKIQGDDIPLLLSMRFSQ
jgi:hypothetical protein